MITAIALQIITGILRQRALEGKYPNFSLFHRVSDSKMSNDSPVFQGSVQLFKGVHGSSECRKISSTLEIRSNERHLLFFCS